MAVEWRDLLFTLSRTYTCGDVGLILGGGHQTHTNTQLYVSAFSLERSLKLVQDLPKGHFCVQTEGVGDLGPVQSPEP